MAKRLRAMGVERYRRAFDVTLHYDLLDAPQELAQSTPRLCKFNERPFPRASPNQLY